MIQLLIFIIGGIFILIFINKKIFIKIFRQRLIFIFILILLIIGLNENFYCFIRIRIGIDVYSYGLIVIVGWILGLMIIRLDDKEFNIKPLMNLIIILIINIFLLFYRLNLLFFYLFFEVRLIPIVFIIVKWGYRIDRFISIIYIYFYTLFFSLPLILIIFYLFKNLIVLNYRILSILEVNINIRLYLAFIIIFPFLVKLPIYILHGWLPKAHVEAPLIGSIFLAGVLLKLGGYGLIRFIIIFENLFDRIKLFIIVFRLLGGLILSIECLIQVDIKILVAYSSVVHISAVLRGLLTINLARFKGRIILMIGHGLCSSGLFYLVNLRYKLTQTRNILINRGIKKLNSKMTFFWFLLCISNISFPLSLNFIGEIFLIIGIINYRESILSVLILIIFFSACYTLYLYSYTQYIIRDYLYIEYKRFNIDYKIKEFIILIFHIIPLLIIFFCLSYIF